MGDLLKLAGYLLGVLAAGRLAYLWFRSGKDPMSHDDAQFTAAIVGVLWPLTLGFLAILAPFIAVGWIVSRPTRAERREAKRG